MIVVDQRCQVAIYPRLKDLLHSTTALFIPSFDRSGKMSSSPQHLKG